MHYEKNMRRGGVFQHYCSVGVSNTISALLSTLSSVECERVNTCLTNPLMNQWKTLENQSFQYKKLFKKNMSKKQSRIIISLVSIIDSLTGLSQHFQRRDNPL